MAKSKPRNKKPVPPLSKEDERRMRGELRRKGEYTPRVRPGGGLEPEDVLPEDRESPGFDTNYGRKFGKPKPNKKGKGLPVKSPNGVWTILGK
jgi:hypothetical protein